MMLFLAAACADDVKYGVASWPEAGHGNHRALVRVNAAADAVWAHIEWRRRDRDADAKAILVFDQATGKRVLNVVHVDINREFGDFVFQPVTAPGVYEAYYLPYNPGTGNFDDAGTYFKPEATADAAWVGRNGLGADALAAGGWKSLPRADLVEIQARNEFNRFDPMEVIATDAEVAKLLADHPADQYLLFPEDRKFAVRMFDDLPLKWIRSGPSTEFHGEAQPGEYYVFQIAVYAARQPISNVALGFGDLKSDAGKTIPASGFTCFNLSGTDWLGRPMTLAFPVGKGQVRPLWIGVQIPKDAAGTYRGSVRVSPVGEPPSAVSVVLDVSGAVLADAGDSDLWRLSRLRWLNSTLGIDDDVIPPYTPLTVSGATVKCLNRAVTFGPSGLPSSLRSNGREILAAPAQIVLDTAAGRLRWTPGPSKLTAQKPGRVERASSSTAGPLSVAVDSKMEFDGCITFRATLTAKSAADLRDVRLELPIRRDVAPYMMGMSARGGFRPKEWKWSWNATRADEMVWLGDWNAGLQLKLLAHTDTWPNGGMADTIVAPSWSNDGKGGATITEAGDRVLVRAFTGPRRLAAGEKLELRFRFLVTPFKPIDPNHWNWRYGDVNADGNILHVHHATFENPYINYPFLTSDRLADLVKKVKAIQGRRSDFGSLSYPAEGNIHLDRGSVSVWTTVNFDPKIGEPLQSRFNRALFYLNFPNEDQFGFYWNIDARGMRAYLRRGSPALNQFQAMIDASAPQWKQGERHLLTVSWGDRLAIFIDGKLAAAAPYAGLLATPLRDATLRFEGDGFLFDAIKITDASFDENVPATPAADAHTLLLDTFASTDGKTVTRPERIAAGGEGKLAGVCELAPGDPGRRLHFSSTFAPTPPKGVNLYYTVRELSNHVAELWALRSLGDEVIANGPGLIYSVEKTLVSMPGGGYPWLREHLVSGYVPGWRQPLFDGETDAAFATQGLSRWHNYYVEGMRWLMQHTGVDGLYLDGIGYDREIMKRIAKVMYRANPKSRINFHSGNSYDYLDWRVSPASLYMEHFPYITNLWFGEMYDYSRSPDYWLVEISGLPFGLTSEMLEYQNGGNPYRGMIYGMTGRLHPSASAMWRFWDEVGIQDARMIGYWQPDCPVHTSRPDVLATVYRKPGQAVIALAHWPEPQARPQAFTRAAAKPPAIDGRLDPGEWDDATRLTNFSVFGTKALANQATEVFVTHDGENLYIAVRCAASATPRAVVKDRDGQTWTDDAIEVFLQPDLSRGDYFQLVGNSAGAFYDSAKMDGSWNAPWVYRASVSEGKWEAEMSIPFKALGMTAPAEGTTIGLNYCRDQQTPSAQASCWSPASTSFHDPSIFGRLIYSQQSPPTREQDVDPAVAAKALGVRLSIDWKALGLDPAKVKLTAPAIDAFQPAATFRPGDEIPVAPSKGWLLVVK